MKCRRRVAVVFDNFGPYHLARLRAAAAEVELLAIEVHGRSQDYAWDPSAASEPFQRITLRPESVRPETGASEIPKLLAHHLCTFQPCAVLIPGWSSRVAFAAMVWCVRNRVPAVLMSESTAHDEVRSGWREMVKRSYVTLASAALAGGNLHAEYLAQLGMPRDRVFLGYDAVDNRYFSGGRLPDVATVSDLTAVVAPYFLASARFIKKKNLPLLVRAYARYRKLISLPKDRASSLGTHRSEVPWGLVLLGDGEKRRELESLLSTLSLDEKVQMPGFVQYSELPRYYASANAFVHASTTEQWGLVVNEAMASGLPVLVSDRCGCAPDLVRDGVNGWTFDPENEEQLAQLMLRVSSLDLNRLSSMGESSERLIADWGTGRFAEGLHRAVECAVIVGPKRAGLKNRSFLTVMSKVCRG